MPGHIPKDDNDISVGSAAGTTHSINLTKNHKTTETVAATDQGSLRDLHDWFFSNAGIKFSDATETGQDNVKMSEFRGCQVLTVTTIVATPESPSTYSNSNNGTITITVDADSVVPDTSTNKLYSFSNAGDGSYTDQVDDNTMTYSGLNNGTYNVFVKDRYTGAKCNNSSTVVNYGGSTNTYSDIQNQG
jgi:hypothetical protein